MFVQIRILICTFMYL